MMAIFDVAGVEFSCWAARRIWEREAAVTRSREPIVTIFFFLAEMGGRCGKGWCIARSSRTMRDAGREG